MGAWGYGIFEDDFACDVKDEFEELIEDGKTVEKATKFLLKEYKEIIEDDENENALFYLALAKIQFDSGVLMAEIKDEAVRIIDNDIGLELWEEDEAGLAERKKVLQELKSELLK